MVGTLRRALCAAAFATLLFGVSAGSAAVRPPPPKGIAVIAPGTPPHVCAAGDTKYGATGYSPVFGVYYSKAANGWVSAPLCYPRWGNLEMSPARVGAGGSTVTVTAIPNQGSNSAEWATKPPGAITWTPAGTPKSGCTKTSLACTVKLPPAAAEWQWLMFHVTLPRTYFIDSKGEFCAGVHACPGTATNGWTFVGVPPKGTQAPKDDEKRGTIAGRVVETTCGEKSCSEKGLAGVTVVAAGKDGGSDVTGSNGRYSIDVAPGGYRVTPTLKGRDFDPPWSQVTVSAGGSAGTKFSTCAEGPTTKSLEGSEIAQAAMSRCDTFKIDWTMPDRVRAAGWNSAPEPSADYIYPPAGWQLKLFLKHSQGSPFLCRAGHTYTWRIAPRGSKNADVASDKPCRLTTKVPREGIYTVTVEEHRKSDGVITAKTTRNVPVQDFLLIGTGDSNGSGQANPPYWNRQCDRSDDSYQMKAAQYIEQADERTSVTFVHLACSGARTVHIADRPYAGQEPGQGEMLQPQLISLRQALNKGERLREIDAMIMSIGINDLRFGGILGVCLGNAKNRVVGTAAPCPDLPVVRALDKVGEPTLQPAPGTSKGDGTLREAVNFEIKQLPGRYATLKTRIAARISIKPARIIATTYPDESWRAEGVLCDETSGYLPRLLATEWQWLSDAGGALNRAVDAAFPTAVTTIPKLFVGHGYCTSAADNWFRSITSSYYNQGNEFGTFHATREGHVKMSFAVIEVLCPQLYPGQTKTGNCSGTAREPG